MTQKLWQEKPKLNYSKDVFDIAQFGSSIFEDSKPNDIDIAIIFNKIPVKEQLNQSQEIKKQLQKYSSLPIHVSSFDLYNFFDSGNFARDSILFYGRSLVSGKYFSEKFNLSPKLQISYSLKNLKKKDKIRFNYMLNGKKGKYGLSRQYGGKIISPGIIEIMPECEKIFIQSIKTITDKFTLKKTFSL